MQIGNIFPVKLNTSDKSIIEHNWTLLTHWSTLKLFFSFWGVFSEHFDPGLNTNRIFGCVHIFFHYLGLNLEIQINLKIDVAKKKCSKNVKKHINYVDSLDLTVNWNLILFGEIAKSELQIIIKFQIEIQITNQCAESGFESTIVRFMD